MTPPLAKGRTWILVVMLVATTGCMLKLAYNYSDWLALLWIDQYFDLTEEQKQFVSDRLKVIVARHRQEALPRYASFLTDVRERFRVGLTGSDVDWFFDSYEALRTDLFERLVDDGAQFLSTVDEKQLEYLEQSVRKDNERFVTRLQEPQKERLEKRATATVDWLEDWLGPLQEGQEQEIRRMSLALPDTLGPWLEYRRARQQEFLRLLRSSQNDQDMLDQLRAWLLFPENGAPPTSVDSRREMRQGVKAMALEIDRMMTAQQREHLLVELGDVIDDLQDLSEDV